MKLKAVNIYVRSRRGRSFSAETDSVILDLTSKGTLPWLRFSPFYPLLNIPVPGWPGLNGASVEGIWQGLKRLENEDHIDSACLKNTTMRNLKRTSRGKNKQGTPRGRVLGHQFGPEGDILLDYVSARRKIYVPAYLWVLQNRLASELMEIRSLAATTEVVLLDYGTNGDIENTARPLSHCGLVKRFLEGTLTTD